jgi:hypothetical protein
MNRSFYNKIINDKLNINFFHPSTGKLNSNYFKNAAKKALNKYEEKYPIVLLETERAIDLINFINDEKVRGVTVSLINKAPNKNGRILYKTISELLNLGNNGGFFSFVNKQKKVNNKRTSILNQAKAAGSNKVNTISNRINFQRERRNNKNWFELKLKQPYKL